MKKLYTLTKLSLTLFLLGIGITGFGQTYLSETFDGTTFPPTGWSKTQLTGTATWTRVTAGTYPTATPKSGAGMIQFPYSAASAVLITPVIDLTTASNPVVEFWFYRDGSYSQYADYTEIFINTTADIAGATSLGVVNRNITLSPVVATSGWYKYSFAIPASFNTATNFVLIKGLCVNSASDNMFVDELKVYTPVTPDGAPTTFSISSLGKTGLTLNWVDNSTNETGFRIYKSTDNINFSQQGIDIASTTVAATGGAYSQPITGLTPNTLYYFKIVSFVDTESSPLTGSETTLPPTPMSGTYTVGTTGAYQTLTAAFNDITLNGLSGSIKLELLLDYDAYNEPTFPIVPSKNATSTNTITIYPKETGVIIDAGSQASGLFNFDGVKYVTIDGSVGGNGTVKDLIIKQPGTLNYVIQFVNDASNNIIKNCFIKGGCTTNTIGLINFAGTTGTTGNDDNLIDNCDVMPAITVYTTGIYSSGNTSVGKENSGNTISNCNIYNFANISSASGDYGIYLAGGNTSWTITGNNFYQTSSRSYTAAATHYAINIASSSGNGFIVSNNNIGGNTANAGGSAWTITYGGTAYANRFVGIKLSVGTTTASSVQGNTIANMVLNSSSGATSTGGIWCGIYVTSGNVNIGTSVGNILGNSTGTGSISTTITTSGGLSTGIYVEGSTTTANVSNNSIGSITTSGSTTSVSHSFTGIVTTGGTLTINSNIIGSTTTANSINASNAATSNTSANTQQVIGINNSSSGTVSITNNTIANLNSSYSPSSANTSKSIIYGIVTTNGTNTITGNTLKNLTTVANATATSGNASIIGISMNSAAGSALISNNSISSLSNNNTGANPVLVTGIFYNGSSSGTNIVERNLVYGLNTLSTSESATLCGVQINGGTTTYQNNMISLGSGISSGYIIYGIYENLGTNNVYFNSVYVGGTATTSNQKTFAFYGNQTFSTRSFRNNIFVNTRSTNAGTGKNYAVKVGGSGVNPSGLTCDYNIYQATGTAGVLGYFNSADVADLAAWRTNVGQDSHSLYSDPKFVDPSNATPDLHLQGGTPADMAGVDITTITTDFFGDTRSALTPTDIGADAGNFDNTVPTVTITPADASTGVNVGDNIIFTFSEKVRKTNNSAIDASIITFVNVTDGNTPVPFTAAYDDVTKKLTVKLSPDGTSMLGFKNYKVSISGVEDLNDNALIDTYTSFTTGSADLTAPTFSSANVENSAPKDVVVTFSENIKLDNANGFTVKVDGTSATINSYSLNNNILTLTLIETVTSHQAVTIEYAGGSVKDISDNSLAAFNAQTVTNNTMSSAKDFLTFNFKQSDNAVLTSDINGNISAKNVDLYVPMGTDVTSLIATFTTSPYVQKVEVSSTAQTSGSTSNSFAVSVTYKVTAEDNSIKNYIVTVHPIHSTPYTQGFEGTFPATDWMMVNEGMGNSWMQSGTFHSGAKSMYYSYSANPANAWAYTPALSLISGKKYVIEFWEKVSVQNEKMKVTAGLYPNVAAQTLEIWKDEALLNYSNFEKVKSIFIAPTSDSYHFGFNCYSDANKSNLYVDDITIREIGTDAKLTSLKVDGNSVVGFASSTLSYSIELPYGTTAIPQITESNLSDVNATKVLTQATSLNGTVDERTAKVEVTAEDGVTKNTYTVEFTVAKNNVASLSDLKVDGTTVDGFASSTYTYNIELPYGTAAIPQITEATMTDANASKVITQATNLTGTLAERTAKVEVTAENGIAKQTYSVVFTVAKNNVATLSDLKVDGTTVSGFAASTFTYNVELPFGTTAVPQITEATLTDANASMMVTQAANLTGTLAERTAKVEVTAENGTDKHTYSIVFTVAKSNVATLSDLKVDGTTVSGFAASTFTYNVELPYGTTTVPQITEATLTDANATKVITQAANLTGTTVERTAKVEVTAENGTDMHTYSIIFTVAAPTTYAVNFSVIGGNGSISATVDGNAIASGAQVILGKNIEFTASPSNGFRVKEWKNNSVPVNGNTSNSYTVSNISATATVNVEFEAIPPTKYVVNFSVVGANGAISATVDGCAITSGSNIIEGKSVVFTATPNANYKVKEWKNNGSIVTGNTTNTFTLSNLSAATTVTVEFEISTAINDNDQARLAIYPNPFSSTIKLKGKIEISKIEISNIIGQIMLVSYPRSEEYTVNTEYLKTGVYIVRVVESNGNITTQKMIKK